MSAKIKKRNPTSQVYDFRFDYNILLSHIILLKSYLEVFYTRQFNSTFQAHLAVS